MKSKLLLLSFLMLLNVATSYAQSSATASGIAIQGIARDNNNTARLNATLTLNFRIYYGANNEILDIDKTVNTDAFGVFSVIIEPDETDRMLMANNQSFLKITEGTTIISDEKFKQVPYAISANNGVPTGSIMPYIGTTAPEGWLLCDGVTNVPNPSALYDLIGGTTPNLRGMFLRGAGDDGRAQTETVNLKAEQGDVFKNHLHGVGNLVNGAAGGHNHITKFVNDDFNGSGVVAAQARGLTADSYTPDVNNPNPGIVITDVPSESEADHNHTISGETAIAGGSTTETRPINYGVNYIIKL